MTYAWPVYMLRVAFSGCQVAACFGLEGLLETVPRLGPDLYTICLYGSRLDVATAAVHPSGAWSLNFSDGREYGGRVGEHPFIM